MNKLLASSLLAAAAVVASSPVWACDGLGGQNTAQNQSLPEADPAAPGAAKAKAELATVSVDELAGLLARARAK